MKTETAEKMELKNMVKLNYTDLKRITEGDLIFIEHPEKGNVFVDYDNIYVNTIEPDWSKIDEDKNYVKMDIRIEHKKPLLYEGDFSLRPMNTSTNHSE